MEAFDQQMLEDPNHVIDLVFSGAEDNFGTLLNLQAAPEFVRAALQYRPGRIMFSIMYLATSVRESDGNFHLRVCSHSVTFGGRVVWYAEAE
jgi:hypothetical protein